jgi:hypothetical protein
LMKDEIESSPKGLSRVEWGRGLANLSSPHTTLLCIIVCMKKSE